MLSMMRSLCVVAVFCLSGSALWAQDERADGVADVVPSVDSAPVEEAPAAPPATGKLVYKSIDSKGQITFTDSPPAGRPSEAIKVKAANTMPVRMSAPEGEISGQDEKKKEYTVEITSPANDELFGQDTESVTIAAQLSPGLQDGDTFQLYYDGKPVGGGETAYTVTELYRGTHTVEAKVFDGKKKLLKAASPVQFTVRRTSALNNLTATQPAKGDPVPAPPMSGFGGIKGAGSSGDSNSARDAGGLGDAGSSGGANSLGGSGIRTKNR